MIHSGKDGVKTINVPPRRRNQTNQRRNRQSEKGAIQVNFKEAELSGFNFQPDNLIGYWKRWRNDETRI